MGIWLSLISESYIPKRSFYDKDGLIMSRREAREQAFILIFEKSFQPEIDVAELVEYAKENEIFVADKYAVGLVNNTYDNLEKIDEMITGNLKGWSSSRISKITRAILRMTVCEMLYYEDVPTGVAINEAVEVAKKFAADDEPSYINGVLGSISKSL